MIKNLSKSVSLNCKVDTLTAIFLSIIPASLRVINALQLSSNTKSPIAIISSDSSAIGINFSGDIEPIFLFSHLIRASALIIFPV